MATTDGVDQPWKLDEAICQMQKKENLLTVMTDSVVLLSSDLALLRGGKEEVNSSPWTATCLCS